MSKKTIILLITLALVTIILALIAAMPYLQKTSPIIPTPTILPTPTPIAHSILTLSPNTLSISSNSGSVDVNIDTTIDKVTGVEVNLSFDPKVISNVKLTPSTFFEKTMVLRNEVSQKDGTLSYIIVIPLTEKGKIGQGTVATISFNNNLLAGQQTNLTFLPKTEITAQGIDGSVLKESTGATIIKAGL